jgi:seryl-tRNA synthetase
MRLELAQVDEIRSRLKKTKENMQKKRKAKSGAIEKQKEEGKTQVLLEEATKKLIDLMNDYSKDSAFESVIELLLSDVNPNAKTKVTRYDIVERGIDI